jgi:Methylamine utilisation protein MauE
MPSWLVATAARAVVVFEVILGVAWLVQLTPVPVVGGTVLLLASYAGAITLNLVRGRVHISCGCGGHDRQPLSWWMLPRNLILIVAAMSATLPVTDRSLGWADGLLATVTLLILVLIHLAVTQLLANAAAIRVWRAA